MKKYEASQELVDILLKNGFEDKTEQHYPEFYSAMQRNGYSTALKRKFSYHSHKDYIIFDYINIHAFRGHAGLGSRARMTELELKSLIAFFKMPATFRGNWRSKNGEDVFGLYAEYQRTYKNPLYDTADNRRLKKIFDEIELN